MSDATDTRYAVYNRRPGDQTWRAVVGMFVHAPSVSRARIIAYNGMRSGQRLDVGRCASIDNVGVYPCAHGETLEPARHSVHLS